ncbi:MAG TPA: sigma factor-like helix-turn-helix DNA-binding protein [Polyangiales bacterium]|nr:sigma factor-like helix-turn-helix DNA-binding protein [Polyangiales bacterium]
MEHADLAKLYARYGYTVFRRCAVYLGVESAPAAVRDVFVQAVRAGGPPAGSDPRTWLCRIADALHSERISAVGNVEAPGPDPEASGFLPAGTTTSVAPFAAPAGEQTPLPSPAVDEALGREVADDDREALLIVQRLLQRVPSALRRLAVLYYLDELTEEELARELGWSRRNVSRRVQGLLEQARSLLREREAS